MKIIAKKLTKGSLFRLIFISSFIPMGLFFLFCGLAAIGGAATVKWNNEAVTGGKGFGAALLMYPFFMGFFTVFTWIPTALGLWIYSWFKPLNLEFVEGEVLTSSLGAEQGAGGDAAR
jgi:hypothetical protein